MNRPHNFSRFSRSVWLTAATFAVFVVVFAIYVRSEKLIDRANELRLQSYVLMDELRQSSDYLSQMARSYVVTGDPIYKQYFQDIIDIREGKQPRPLNYHDVYWDLAIADARALHPSSGQTIALLELMRQAGFAEPELAKMVEASAYSDALTVTERAAMAMVEANHADIEIKRNQASLLLHDEAYHQAKANIMRSIGEAYRLMDRRTLQAVSAKETAALWIRCVFVLLGIVSMLMLWRVHRTLHATLGVSVDELHSLIIRLGQGDFSETVPNIDSVQNSVVAWLSETQLNLARIDTERRAAEAKNQRLTQLYAALSQCNQAIVRCTSEAELFPQICRDVVIFGGMQMAWIGMLEDASQSIKPVASYGSGSEYLRSIEISIDGNLPTGCGPTGTAVREDQPFWCQDFQHDPATIAWHERGGKFDWKASAALPLHLQGKTIGAFMLYADTVNAFDDAARNLLLEMAMDIDHALNGFQRETERFQAQQMESFRIFMLERLNGNVSLMDILRDVVTELESMLAGSLCSILLVDDDQRLRKGAAPSLPDFYNQAIDGLKIGAGLGSCGNTAYTGQRTIVENIANHPFWQSYLPLAERAGLAACWSEPIFSSSKKVLGTFAIYHRHPAVPDKHELRLLEMVAHFVALAIERKQAQEHIYYLANYDPLTGLPNRSQLDDHLKYALSLAKRSNGHLALMFLDLDHFKDINDTLGHSVGDALLVELAKRLCAVLREEDTVTRLGGDEFIFLLPGTDADGAANVAQKLLDAIAEPYRIEQFDLTMSASIGIALYPHDGEDLESLSKSADIAMYRVKTDGRHGYRFFTPEMHARAQRNLQLVNALRYALDRRQLNVYYQPQADMHSGRVIGAEALLRWNHPEFGMVSPAEFIPVAEDSGLILPIGEWVLQTAVRQAKTWLAQGLGPLTMAVNLSAAQFSHPALPDVVTRILAEEGLPPEYLELELTEGVSMQNPEAAIAVMNNLHQRGVRMSIDDFGTGYSSLSYLKKFKVYKLKIDQSFVRDISTDSEDKAIVSAVISLAGSLGLRTIAEGVETIEQREFLREQGCQEIQGYLFGKPMPSEQFEVFLRQSTVYSASAF
ncbi:MULTISPECIES: EAL domain-containing protein [Methylomonas]|uniref:cyclic-guanylate-specific phosphodiesterase n=2 Tax=Methylomonas TaxID=416 RepID=A0A140E466_9GAMM|nr:MULTISPECIES: EAL domain-containing protein [Methylomonas]AMK75190.1 diguanylate cyclase [Methylomonas denitrificans]OAH99411.1 diguanylate cyclase [Methylomonas methanica]TCV85063.1 diguanylate cyclase (GGDEF)-like protein [Methylomonas methanica]